MSKFYVGRSWSPKQQGKFLLLRIRLSAVGPDDLTSLRIGFDRHAFLPIIHRHALPWPDLAYDRRTRDPSRPCIRDAHFSRQRLGCIALTEARRGAGRGLLRFAVTDCKRDYRQRRNTDRKEFRMKRQNNSFLELQSQQLLCEANVQLNAINPSRQIKAMSWASSF